MDVEDVLSRALQEAGVVVERGTELLELYPSAEESGVHARLVNDGRAEDAECCFLAGCDGSGSTVRRGAGVDFIGSPHHEEVVLADVDLDGLPVDGRLHVTLGAPGLLWLFPLGEGAPWRLLATRPAAATGGDPQGELDRLLHGSGLAATVTACRWFRRTSKVPDRAAARVPRLSVSSSTRACSSARSPPVGMGRCSSKMVRRMCRIDSSSSSTASSSRTRTSGCWASRAADCSDSPVADG